MIDMNKGGRTTSWRFVRVRRVIGWKSEAYEDNVYEEVGTVSGITSCSIEEAQLTSLKVSGSIEYVDMPDLGDDLLRVYADMELDGDTESKCYGTFFVYSKSEEVCEGSHVGTADLYSVLVLLEQRLLEGNYAVGAAYTANYLPVVSEMVYEVGLPLMLTPGGWEVAAIKTWEVGTSFLEMANDIMELYGYGSLNVDVWGNVIAKPYQDPETAVATTVFSDTEEDVSDETIKREWDVHDTPNVVVVRSKLKDDSEVIGSAENADPNNPYSTAARGMRIVRFEEVEGLETKAQCQEKAKALLIEGMQSIERLTIGHAGKRFNAGDNVAVDYQRSGLSGKYSAYKRSVKATPDTESETTMRRTVKLYGNVAKS